MLTFACSAFLIWFVMAFLAVAFTPLQWSGLTWKAPAAFTLAGAALGHFFG